MVQRHGKSRLREGYAPKYVWSRVIPPKREKGEQNDDQFYRNGGGGLKYI